MFCEFVAAGHWVPAPCWSAHRGIHTKLIVLTSRWIRKPEAAASLPWGLFWERNLGFVRDQILRTKAWGAVQCPEPKYAIIRACLFYRRHKIW